MKIPKYILDEPVQEKLDKDLAYIKSEILCKYNFVDYCKFSRLLNAISVPKFSRSAYVKYWSQMYTYFPEEQQIIIEACNNKLDTGLVTKEYMLDLVKKSKDKTTDKLYMVSLLSGTPIRRQPTGRELDKEVMKKMYFGK